MSTADINNMPEEQPSPELGPDGPVGLRDVCVRASIPGPSFEPQGGSMPVMKGYLAVFDEWAAVDSRLEGKFMERMKRGAFSQTINQDRDRMRVLFQHGMDQQIGIKPLGKIIKLEEDQRGVAYEVELFDVDYVRGLLPALEAGQFGSSFTFRPTKDIRVPRPQRSTYNPDGIPEVTVSEVRMREFGPCMFPVYEGTTASTRSTTDDLMADRLEGFVLERLTRDPLRLAQFMANIAPQTALSTERAEPPHSQREELPAKALVPEVRKSLTNEEWLTWLSRSKNSIR